MAGELVLITGTTGHLGFRTLRYALEHGYRVRATVRSEAKAKSILSNPALVELKTNPELSFAVVPDITAADAYDEAIKYVSYVIHIASPLATAAKADDYEASVVQPATQGTLTMLEAAKKSGTVKRVVITASLMSITPWSTFLTGHYDGVLQAHDRIPTPEGPYSMALEAYWASKVIALNRAEDWIAKQKPSFDVIHIHPSYIEGRNDTSTTVEDLKKGTNWVILGLATGETSPPNFCTTNSVHDTAWVHVRSLDPKIPGNQSFAMSSPGDDGTKWNDVKDIIVKNFPEAVEKGILSTNGNTPTPSITIDNKETEQTFGFKLRSFEEQVVEVVEQYLEIVEKTAQPA